MLFLHQNGEISTKLPQVSLLDHGFLFGDSIYEVVRVYGGKMFAWKEHESRLQTSADRLGIPLEKILPNLRVEGERLLQSFGKQEAVLRIIITRGEGKLHIDPSTCLAPTVLMAAWEFDTAFQPASLRVMIPEIRRNHPRTMDPAIKSGNYLNSVMALHEAKRAGYEDALFLNLSDCLAELTTSNIGWISKEKIYTPALDVGILRGVTREYFVRSQAVDEVSWSHTRLSEVDELFALSTLKEVVPIRELRLPSGESLKWSNFPGCAEIQRQMQKTIKFSLEAEKQVVFS